MIKEGGKEYQKKIRGKVSEDVREANEENSGGE